MGNIVNASLSVRGVRPLLWHKFGPESLPLEKQEKTGVAGNSPDEWRTTVTYTSDGQLYLEPSYLFGCMREGGRYTTRSRATLMKFVAATLIVANDRLLIDRWIPGWAGQLPEDMPTDPDLPVYLDVRGVKNPATKARNVRYRVAASVGWTMSAHLIWDKTVVSRQEMEAIAIDAGRLVGLGDGRSIGFGRFEIEAFETEE